MIESNGWLVILHDKQVTLDRSRECHAATMLILFNIRCLPDDIDVRSRHLLRHQLISSRCKATLTNLQATKLTIQVGKCF
jgi:hypothetical protein